VKLEHCVRAWAGEYGDFAVPAQTITYLSSHDDWTLWDKLVCTLDQKRRFTGYDERVIRANKLAFAMLAGCQGHLFLLSGEEFGRTKNGVKNSYNTAVTINRMDWQRCWKNRDLVEYYRGLIALRKQQPGLCDKSAAAGERILESVQLGEDAAAVRVDNGANSAYPELILAYNVGGESISIDLPKGKWAVLADGESSLLWQKPEIVAGDVKIHPMAALILGKVKA